MVSLGHTFTVREPCEPLCLLRQCLGNPPKIWEMLCLILSLVNCREFAARSGFLRLWSEVSVGISRTRCCRSVDLFVVMRASVVIPARPTCPTCRAPAISATVR